MTDNDATRKNWNEWGWKVFVGMIVGVIVALIVWQAVVCSSCTYGGGCWFRNCSDSSGGGGDSCTSDSDCTNKCCDGACAECCDASDCGANKFCNDQNQCVDSSCTSDSDCTNKCCDGVCAECCDASDCNDGLTCYYGTCRDLSAICNGTSDSQSAAIAGLIGDVCYAPAEHTLGSFALQNALTRDLTGEPDEAMKTALNLINNDRTVVYAVGSAGVSPCLNNGTCDDNNGKCYQLRVNAEATKTNKDIDVIMQSVNTGLPNSFDVFQAQGGAGAFGGDVTACDMLWGSKPEDSLFWSDHIQDSTVCQSIDETTTDQEVQTLCTNYFDFVDPPQPYMKESLIESCRVSVGTGLACPDTDPDTIQSLQGSWREVKCPFNLTEVSGLRRTDEIDQYPTNDSSDTSWLGTDTWGTMDDVEQYNPTVSSSNTVNAEGKFLSDLQITQMMDCRSPEASQNFPSYASPDGSFLATYYSNFCPYRTAAYNINLKGDVITQQGYHQCNLYVGSSADEWEYFDLTTTDGSDTIDMNTDNYRFGNCPSAFPPDVDKCLRYSNKQECGNRAVAYSDDKPTTWAGAWDPSDPSSWQTTGQCSYVYDASTGGNRCDYGTYNECVNNDCDWQEYLKCDDDPTQNGGMQFVYKGSDYGTAKIGDYEGYTDPNKSNSCYWENCPGYLGGGSSEGGTFDPATSGDFSIPQNDKLYEN